MIGFQTLIILGAVGVFARVLHQGGAIKDLGRAGL
jgi:hypothetical protein